MGILIEGVQSIALACSIVLLIPAIGIGLLGRRRAVLVTTWILVSGVIAWLKFVTWWPFYEGGVAHTVAGAAMLGLGGVAWRRDSVSLDIGVTAGVSAITTWAWQPCVGNHLGDVLNSARQEPWAQFTPSMLYMLGIFMPLVLVAAADGVWPKFAAWSERLTLRRSGMAILLAVAGLVAVNLLDDLASELLRRSSW